MNSSATAAVIGFVFGGIFLLLALFSTLSKVTLSLFNPWLFRRVSYHEQPRTFAAVVFLYWLLGAAGIIVAIAGLFRS
jgi:hypothetical protein